MLSMLHKNFSRRYFEIHVFFLFSRKIGFGIHADCLLGNPVFWGEKNKKNSISLLSAVFAQRAVKVNI